MSATSQAQASVELTDRDRRHTAAGGQQRPDIGLRRGADRRQRLPLFGRVGAALRQRTPRRASCEHERGEHQAPRVLDPHAASVNRRSLDHDHQLASGAPAAAAAPLKLLVRAPLLAGPVAAPRSPAVFGCVSPCGGNGLPRPRDCVLAPARGCLACRAPEHDGMRIALTHQVILLTDRSHHAAQPGRVSRRAPGRTQSAVQAHGSAREQSSERRHAQLQSA